MEGDGVIKGSQFGYFLCFSSFAHCHVRQQQHHWSDRRRGFSEVTTFAQLSMAVLAARAGGTGGGGGDRNGRVLLS